MVLHLNFYFMPLTNSMEKTSNIQPDSKEKNERTNAGSFIFCLVLIGADQLSKYLIFRQPLHLPLIVQFRNYNFAFSLPVPTVGMYAIYCLVLAGVAGYFFTQYKYFSRIEITAWLLILSGAIANVGERLVLGYVRDFILVADGIFNFADFYIIFGIMLLLVRNMTMRTRQ